MHDRGDQVLGCLLGGAIGDAFGGPYEGLASPDPAPDSRPWRISDDTQLTLATCEAIIEAGGKVEPSVIAARFARWFKDKRISGIGASTYKALSELVSGGHWALVGNKGERAAGNGAAMRIAPLAFCLDPTDLQARRLIRDVSRITHHNEEAYAGALAFAVAVRAAWDGAWSGAENLLKIIVDVLPDTQVRDRLIELDKLEGRLSIQEIGRRYGSSGFVVESVPLALYGAQRIAALGFEQMILELISAGGDTDTVASMAGQVGGTFIGRSSIDEGLVARLPDLQLVEIISIQFAEAVLETSRIGPILNSHPPQE